MTMFLFIYRWAGYDVNVHRKILEEYARVDEVGGRIYLQKPFFDKLLSIGIYIIESYKLKIDLPYDIYLIAYQIVLLFICI